MKTMISLVLVLAVAGCGKKEESAAKASPCGAAVARGVDQTIAKRRGPNAPAMTAEEAAVPTKLKAALEKTCVETKWSQAVLDCYNTAPDIATCKEQLTPEQRGAYTQAAMSVMAGARGAGGMPPHGAPPPSGDTPPPGGSTPPPGGSAPPAGGSAPPSGDTPPPPVVDGSAASGSN